MLDQEQLTKERLQKYAIPTRVVGALLGVSDGLIKMTLDGRRPDAVRLRRIYDIARDLEQIAQLVSPLELDFSDADKVKEWLAAYRNGTFHADVMLGAEVLSKPAAETTLELLAGESYPDEDSSAEVIHDFYKKLFKGENEW